MIEARAHQFLIDNGVAGFAADWMRKHNTETWQLALEAARCNP